MKNTIAIIVSVKNDYPGDPAWRNSAYITAESAFHPNPCDSATPGYVMCPPYVFTPSRIAGFSLQARSRPLAHNSARYGKVALVSPNVEVCGTAAGMFDTQ